MTINYYCQFHHQRVFITLLLKRVNYGGTLFKAIYIYINIYTVYTHTIMFETCVSVYKLVCVISVTSTLLVSSFFSKTDNSFNVHLEIRVCVK